MEALQARVHTLEKENTDLKVKLTDTENILKATQSELGRVVVANVMRTNYSIKENVRPTPDVVASRSKRPRSPSLELVDVPRMGKVKEEVVDLCSETQKIKAKDVKQTLTPQLNGESSASAVKRPRTGPSSGSTQVCSNPGPSTTKVTSPNQSISAPPLVVGPKPSKVPGQKKAQHPVRPVIDSFKKYVVSAPTLAIHPPPRASRISRKPFAKIYGGSSQHFLQYIPKVQNPSGLVKRNLVFPQPDLNPALPTAPGEPGLIFSCRHEVVEMHPWSLFVKHDPAVAVWNYMGEYVGEICGKITPDQFKALSGSEQQAWVKILQTQKTGIYSIMRIRIALRKAGLLPAKDKETEERLFETLDDTLEFGVTENDVRSALYEGDEVIDIVRMTCLSYDHTFANDIRRNFDEMGIFRFRKGSSKKTRSNRNSSCMEIIDSDSPEVVGDASDDICVSD